MKTSLSLSLKNVRKVYKVFDGKKKYSDIAAVDNADFTIEAGNLAVLLGPSGCGKTTTLNMIAGFIAPSSGKIFIGETDVTELPAHKRPTATVFQSYALFPHLNVGDNIAYGLLRKKTPKKEIVKKVDEFLELVGLSALKSRFPNQLSGGQQQRVALARSLIIEPSVLLLDEPLSNLDEELRSYMPQEIQRIIKSCGITALYVTHDRLESSAIADQVLEMKDGRVDLL
ncbi:MAG: hypothetical protein Ta2G_16180 [Termitinemataceae bacterium]|nr:MAG: hypothetical protein Ta2G_16180 [Termitinemataceae bacterium]